MAVACSIFALSGYYCYDIPATTEAAIEQDMQKDETDFGLLYTCYAAPNTILPLVSGIIYDKFGTRPVLIFFTSISTLGTVILMIAAYEKNFSLFLFGRTVFGLGCESMYVG